MNVNNSMKFAINISLVFFLHSPFLKPLQRPSRYPLSILNMTPFMIRPLKELLKEMIEGKSPRDVAHSFPSTAVSGGLYSHD